MAKKEANEKRLLALKRKEVAKRQEKIYQAQQELAEWACPFKIGDMIEETGTQNRYHPAERYMVYEIMYCTNKEGYRLLGRRYGYYGGLTKQFRELWEGLDNYRKVKD